LFHAPARAMPMAGTSGAPPGDRAPTGSLAASGSALWTSLEPRITIVHVFVGSLKNCTGFGGTLRFVITLEAFPLAIVELSRGRSRLKRLFRFRFRFLVLHLSLGRSVAGQSVPGETGIPEHPIGQHSAFSCLTDGDKTIRLYTSSIKNPLLSLLPLLSW